MRKLANENLVYPTFLSLGLLGFLFSSVGVSLSELRRVFDLSVDQAGLVSALVQCGYAVFCLVSGLLSDTVGKKRILTVGCLLYGACGVAMGVPSGFAGNAALFAGLGIGSGLIFTSSNALVVALFPAKRDKYLNLHHLVFAVASFASPWVTSRLLLSGARWSAIYHGLGAVSLCVGVFFLFALLFGHRFVDGFGQKSATRAGSLLAGYAAAFRNKNFLLLLAAGLCGMGVQFGVIYLLVMFLTQSRGVEFGAASWILSIFFILLSLGRFICARLVRRFSLVCIVTVLLIGVAATLAAGWLGRGWLSLVMFSLSGLACSGLMPNMLSLATRILPAEVRGAALGVFSMCGGLGGMAVTYGTTLVAARVGLEAGFATVIVVAVAGVGLFLLFARQVRKDGL